MLLQNMPLWHKNYFELKAVEKHQTGKSFYFHFLFLCLKVGQTFPFVKVSLSPLSHTRKGRIPLNHWR